MDIFSTEVEIWLTFVEVSEYCGGLGVEPC
jgi:hypothetical protein